MARRIITVEWSSSDQDDAIDALIEQSCDELMGAMVERVQNPAIGVERVQNPAIGVEPGGDDRC